MGGRDLMFLKFLRVISLLKWYLTTAVSFITAYHTLTKKEIYIQYSSFMLRHSFLKIVFTFRFFCKTFRMSDILAEPPFDWLINLLWPSTFSYQEENSIITTIQSVTIQTYFIDEKALQKINIYFEQSTTLPHIIYCAAFICHLQSQHPVSTFGIEKKRYVVRCKRFLPFRKC